MNREEAERMARNMARLADELPLDYPQAHMKLIDALRDYIRTDESIGRDLLNEGSITPAQFEAGSASLRPMREMLADLEKHEIDPSLGLKGRR
jgi:hypothetical protein